MLAPTLNVTAASAAARTGNLDELKTLVTRDNVALTNGLADHWSLLGYAAEAGKSACVRYLLDLGVDVTKSSPPWGWSPLHGACFSRDVDTVELLLAAGMDRNAMDEYGRSPLSASLASLRPLSKACALYLLDRGVRSRYDDPKAEELPTWIDEYVAAKERCRHACVLVVGIRRLKRSTSAAASHNATDVFVLIARTLWSTRRCREWCDACKTGVCERHGSVNVH